MSITTKEFLGYTLLPRILPRFRELFSFAFSHTAYFVALIFEAVRLLPAEHPYLKKDYFGRYTVSQALVEAYKRLKFDRKHIDQVFIFFTICVGIIAFCGQIIIAVFSFFLPSAWAGGTLVDPNTLQQEFDAGFTLSSIVETQRPENDIAFMLLDRVFGVEGMFDSRIAALPSFPFPYHLGLQTIFQTFSVAMLAVAMLVLTYFVITIVAETVRDGTPFGKRMNRVWAPIRLVLAFGLLVPMANGLNAGQYVVLIAANWGSGFATNALTYYYGEIQESGADTPYGPAEMLVATPNAQDPSDLLHFMLTARACQYATQFYEGYYHGGNTPAIDAQIRAYNQANYQHERITNPIAGYYVVNGGAAPTSAPMPGFGQTAASGVLAFDGSNGIDIGMTQSIITSTGYESILVILGTKNEDLYSENLGAIKPSCGMISMSVSAADNQMSLDLLSYNLATVAGMWQDQEIIDAAAAYAQSRLPPDTPCDTAAYPVSSCPPPAPPDMSEFKARKVEEFKDHFRNMITQAISDNVADLEWCGPAADPYLLSYGWAGAAICYNKIASHNGSLAATAANIPMPNEWPAHLEWVKFKRMEAGANISAKDRFNPTLPGDDDGKDIFDGKGAEIRGVALASYEAYRQWVESGSGSGDGGTPALSGMGLKDLINLIFGTEGIFNMTKPENRDIHPLAQLASAGRALIESAIRNIGIGSMGLGGAIAADIGSLGTTAASFMFSFATISMAAGFVLFYVIPLMPFLYFFFAVAGWVKGIFEAMVGVPLWAIAHLRIDGDGLPGQAAMTGYMLILEIFLRPILILFGLLGSSLIFSGMAKILNEMWSLVVENLTGFDAKEAAEGGFDILDIEDWRSPIDEFFYTVIYAIIIYMVALASFKLVDLIPNFILRWMGQSVEAFGETLGDPAAQLSQKATVGFSATSSKLIGGAESLGQGMASANRTYQDNKAAAANLPPPNQ